MILTINTRYFGDITVNEEDFILFNNGVLGFEECKKFVIVDDANTGISYLQCVDEPNLSLPIVNPYLFRGDYKPTIGESYFTELGGGDTDDFVVYSILSIRESLEKSTLNLKAPLLINSVNKLGLQVIVNDEYSSRESLAGKGEK